MQKLMRAALALLVALSLLPGMVLAEDAPEKDILQVHQIYAGCADCYLLICGDTSFMIDCGTDQEHTKVAMLDYLRHAGFDKLDACIITHYHLDHVGNVNTVLAEFGNEKTAVYGPSYNMASEYLPLAAGYYRQMVNGDEITLGDVHIKCVGPKTLSGMGRVNKDSLNLIVTYGERSFFFTGDYVRCKEVMAEHQKLLEKVDVLKFAHHGMQPYCIEGWVVKAIDPEIVLVPGVFAWSVRDFMRKNNMRDAEILDAGKGHVVITTNGENLKSFTDVQPGQFAQ